MLVLPNNHFSSDPRLDRIPHFDERSRNFPIRSLVADKEIKNKTWTLNLNLDQGEDGACVGFGFSHELAATPKAVKGITFDTAKSLYWDAQRLDDDPGGEYPGNTGPVYQGTSVLAGAKASTTLGYYTGYAWAFSEEDIALAIANKGPVVIGINWYTGMFDPDSDGFLNLTGQVEGGHCTLLRGIKDGYYILHNSWGASWGTKGTAKVRREDMAALLADQGEACLPVRTKKLNFTPIV